MSYKIHISSVATVAGINNTKNQGTRTSKDSRPETRLIRRWVEVYKPKRMKLPLEAENERKEEAAKTKTKDMGKKSKEEDEGFIPEDEEDEGYTPEDEDEDNFRAPTTTTTSSRGKLKSNDDLCTRTKPWTVSVTGGALQQRGNRTNGNGNRRKHLSIHAISGL